MAIKYLDDYVDYMEDLYPEIDRTAIKEMMEDSFALLRKYLKNERSLQIDKNGSNLFGEEYSGRINVRTVYSRFQMDRVNNNLAKRKRLRDKKNE